MKKIIMYVLPFVLLIVGGVAYMTMAGEDSGTINRDDHSFLLEMGDARMMDWAEGNLANEKGTTAKYRKYGSRLMKDQNTMMEALKSLVAEKNIALTEELSEEKTKALNYLKASNGETFDRRFRRMIIRDHKRDINALKKAAESTDLEISNFAKRFLPILEAHLEMARDLNK